MKAPFIFTGLIAVVLQSGAQVIFNTTTDSFVCPTRGGNYCAGDSLQTNIIIRCTGTVGQPGNCNDNLAGVPPIGVKNFAPCYQTSSVAGDAACSFGAVVYPDVGKPFPLPANPNVTLSSFASASASRASLPPVTSVLKTRTSPKSTSKVAISSSTLSFKSDDVGYGQSRFPITSVVMSHIDKNIFSIQGNSDALFGPLATAVSGATGSGFVVTEDANHYPNITYASLL